MGKLIESLLREYLVAYAHKAWSGWMQYMFSKCARNEDGSLTIPDWARDRWTRQMTTEYADLPESEKKSDRDEADAIIEIIERGG
jgi:hypothetical protein